MALYNKGNEDCVVWDGDKSWNDVNCEMREKNYNALCEYPGIFSNANCCIHLLI